MQAQEEFREIKEGVIAEVRFLLPLFSAICDLCGLIGHGDRRHRKQREFGDRSYKAMWRRYRGRVLIACSAQLFAQFVSPGAVSDPAQGRSGLLITVGIVQNGINV